MTSISAKWAAWRRIPKAISSSTRAPAIRRCRLGSARAFAHGRLAAVPVRSHREIHSRDRPGNLRLHVCRSRFASIRRTTSGSSIRCPAMVMKFDPQGRVAVAAGTKAGGAEHSATPAAVPRGGEGGGGGRGGAPGAGAQSDVFNRPTDVAWDAPATSSSPTASATRASPSSTSKGVFVKSWGSKGTAPGQFADVAASRSMRRAMSTSPTAGTSASRSSTTTELSRPQITNVGTPRRICITPGPNPVLYVLQFESAGGHRTCRRDLQDEVWTGRWSASSAKPESCRRSSAPSTRSTAAARTSSCRRDRQFAGAEAHDTLDGRSRAVLRRASLRLRSDRSVVKPFH